MTAPTRNGDDTGPAATPPVEIVVIFRQVDQMLEECITGCLAVDYPRLRLLLLPDHEIDLTIDDPRVSIRPTGELSIPAKRNAALSELAPESEYVAFVDSDAYPAPSWLRAAMPHLDQPSVGAVGGPDLTPPEEEPRRLVAGLAMRQWLAFGPTARMFRSSTPTQVATDLRACNLIIGRCLLEEVRFDESYPACEDAKLSMDLRARGHRLVFARDVVVYHHRRPIFWPLMRQTYYYGRVKALMWRNGTLPSMVIIAPAGLVGFAALTAPLLAAGGTLSATAVGLWMAYAAAVLVSTAAADRRARLWLPTVLGVLAIHLGYGAGLWRSLPRVLLHRTVDIERVPSNA